jgi:hypothetical protein
VSEVVGTNKAARWLGLSERAVRDAAAKGRIPGAYQWEHGCKWLIPVASLEKIRPCPEKIRNELADTAEIA